LILNFHKIRTHTVDPFTLHITGGLNADGLTGATQTSNLPVPGINDRPMNILSY